MDDEAGTIFVRVLREGAAALGVGLSDEHVDAFVRYTDLLLAANARTNLTRITEPAAVASKHFVDSLSVLRACPDLPEGASVADVGTGAGFPGVVLGIVRPDLRLVLIDSLRKRLVFLQEVADQLGMRGVTLVHARAEDLGRSGAKGAAHRGRHDLVTARAVAALPILLEWCAPLVRVGGRFLAMKAGGVDEELAAAGEAQRALHLRLEADIPLLLPATEGEAEPARRRLLLFEKRRPAAPPRPRSAAARPKR